MMAAGDSDASLQEKLREQVATSVREALDKSTAILSNLHRLSGYLDVMSTMMSSPDRLKNALDQIQTVRSDCASLLQTIYLGEIGLQSLQDVGKATMSNMMPMFSDTMSTTSTVTPSIPGESCFFDDGGTSITLGKRPGNSLDDEEPNNKKSTVAVFTCHGCNRKFATNTEPGQIPSHCRNCRSAGAPSTTIHISNVTTGPQGITVMTSPSPILSSTPLMVSAHKQLKQRVSKRGKLNPLICRLCGVSFFYRRCMFRHLRENHESGVDVNDMQQYIEIVQPSSQDGPPSPSSSQPSSLDVTIGSDLAGQSDFSLHAANTSGLNSDSNQESLPESLDVSAVSTSAASFIEAAAQSLHAVEQALLSQHDVRASSQDDSHRLDDDTPTALLAQINPTETTSEMDIGRVKVTTQTEVGSTFREYKCTICNKAFDRPYRLTRHLEIHDPNRPRIPCNYCTKSFTRKDSLESHIKTVHAAVHPYTCTHETCGRTFATRSMYLNHQKVHGESKPYHCQECDGSFTLLADLKDHLKKSHSENEELRCSECFRVCLSQEDLESHKVSDHRFECEICGKIFARLAYLQTHVKVHNGESKFNCRFCSDGFNSIYAYRQHMKTHPEYRRIINVFPCHACNKTFQDPSDLVAHYQTQEHREKATAMGSPIGPSTALSMMEGDLSVMSDLVTHVVMSGSDDMIHNIVDTQGTYPTQGTLPQD